MKLKELKRIYIMKLHHTEVCITYIYRVGTSKKEADKQGTHQWSRFGSYSNANALTNGKKVKNLYMHILGRL